MVQVLLHSRHATEAANTRTDCGRRPLHEAFILENANQVQVIDEIANVNT